MLRLELRPEFLGAHIPQTIVSLRKSDGTGVADQKPKAFLEVTYPSNDVQTALFAVSQGRPNKPIVLIGERGRGKSHILGVIHHALNSPVEVEAWAHGWGSRLGVQKLKDLKLPQSYFPITEIVLNNEFPKLWELLFQRHPRGDYFRGKFSNLGQPVPPRSLLEEMFTEKPVVLILDEFQKWFDGLADDATFKWRSVASGFIQVLSELATDRPDLLILVVSVLDNTTDAFQQIHRNGPVIIDFLGPTAKGDRQKLLLHRLFINRDNIPGDQRTQLCRAYADERLRLLGSTLPVTEHPRLTQAVLEAWPFSPELLDLLDTQILVAQAAQDNRDLIRILASVFRTRGDGVPLITPADFSVDDDSAGVQSLLNSIATSAGQEKLREVALTNLQNIQNSGAAVPRARELVSAIWMRSMAPGRLQGASANDLQLDITRDAAVDRNLFTAELAQLVDNSINIHGDIATGGRLDFQLDTNPKTQVRATAKNAKLWEKSASGVTMGAQFPGKDLEHLRNTVAHILTPETRQAQSKIIVLGPGWQSDPWAEVDPLLHPQKWDTPVLIVIPVPLDGTAAHAVLGAWLAKHVPTRRNTVRFLLPLSTVPTLYADPDLIFAARCSYLTTIAWKDDKKLATHKTEFDGQLRKLLRKRFDRFAVLKTWNYQKPETCLFDIERVEAEGTDIAAHVEGKVKSQLFDPQAFRTWLVKRSEENKTFAQVIDDLAEPPPPGTGDTLPFLGVTQTFEQVLAAVAKGQLALNVGGSWVGRRPEHADEAEALAEIKKRAFRSDAENRLVQLGSPANVAGGATVSAPQPKLPVVIAPTSTPTLDFSAPAAVNEASQSSSSSASPAAPVAPPVPVAVVHKTDAPSSGVALIGSFEKWGVPSDQLLSSVRIELAGLTVQQTKKILQSLPSQHKASLEVVYDPPPPQS